MFQLLTAKVILCENRSILCRNHTISLSWCHMLRRQQLRTCWQSIDIKGGIPLEYLLHIIKQVNNVVKGLVRAGHFCGRGCQNTGGSVCQNTRGRVGMPGGQVRGHIQQEWRGGRLSGIRGLVLNIILKLEKKKRHWSLGHCILNGEWKFITCVWLILSLVLQYHIYWREPVIHVHIGIKEGNYSSKTVKSIPNEISSKLDHIPYFTTNLNYTLTLTGQVPLTLFIDLNNTKMETSYSLIYVTMKQVKRLLSWSKNNANTLHMPPKSLQP